MSRGVWQAAGTADLKRQLEVRRAYEVKRRDLRGPGKIQSCEANPTANPKHRCPLCCKRGPSQKQGRRYVNSGMSDHCEPYARMARAVMGQVLRDLTWPEYHDDATSWLYDNTDPEVVAWRQTLCDLGDMSLAALRSTAKVATTDQLRYVAAVLLGTALTLD